MDATAEVREFVRRMNAVWLEGRPDDLLPLYHPDAVIASPGLSQRTRGREACVQSYRDFLAAAEVRRFEMDDAGVDVFGTTAVATCPYTIEYGIGGGWWRGAGTDLLVLERHGPGWRVAWRTVLAGEEEEIPAPARGADGEQPDPHGEAA